MNGKTLTDFAKFVGPIRTIDIHGKPYVTVPERIRVFHNIYPNGSITADLVYAEGGIYIMKANVIPDMENPDRCFTGYAKEDESKSQINRTSAIENCETSAVGRALGFAGLGSEDSIASAEEVKNAIHQQGSQDKHLSSIKEEGK